METWYRFDKLTGAIVAAEVVGVKGDDVVRAFSDGRGTYLEYRDSTWFTWFPTEAEAASYAIERAEGDIRRRLEEYEAAVVRLRALRERYGDTTEGTANGP